MKLRFALALALSVAGTTARAGITYTTSDGGPRQGAIYQNFDYTPLSSPTTLGPAGDSITVTYAAPAGPALGASPGFFAAPYVVDGSGVPFGDNTPLDSSNKGHLDTTQYLTAGNSSITLSFSTGNHYLGLLWGSVDTYNTLTFFDGTTNLGSVSGGDLFSNPVGNQGENGSRYVNILSTTAFTSVVASSTSYAFEFDNVAYAVPEPASLALCGTALLGCWRGGPASPQGLGPRA